MMLVHYGREVKFTFADEEYLREKVSEIPDHVNHRDRIIKELMDEFCWSISFEVVFVSMA
jgi:hypothetical protein